MKIAIAIIALALGGCATTDTNWEESIGVGPADNAIMCVAVEVPGRFTGSIVRAKRLEFPANFDLVNLTADDFDDLEKQFCD